MKNKLQELKILIEQDLNLDPNFFGDDNKLLPEIRETILDAYQSILDNLQESHNINLVSTLPILTGSLCSVNYDKFSDVDFHILYNPIQFDLSKRNIMKDYLQIYASLWNKAEYQIKDRSFELYFQDINETHETPGIYDIQHDHWIKIPEDVKFEVSEEVIKEADKYLQEIEKFKDDYDSNLSKEDKIQYKEMLSNYFNEIRNMRKQSIKSEGMYSFGNLVFKQLRRNSALNVLTNFIRTIQKEIYKNA